MIYQTLVDTEMFPLTWGKVLVHCLMGMSRSATLVLAFLVKRRNMNVIEALRLVSRVTDSTLLYRNCHDQIKDSRDVRPNDGFLRQLAELELRRKPWIDVRIIHRRHSTERLLQNPRSLTFLYWEIKFWNLRNFSISYSILSLDEIISYF